MNKGGENQTKFTKCIVLDANDIQLKMNFMDLFEEDYKTFKRYESMTNGAHKTSGFSFQQKVDWEGF